MSDERVRKLLREIEDELAGTNRRLADVIRERLRITPEAETSRVRDLIGGRLAADDPHVHQVLVTILHGGATEAALVQCVQDLAESLRLQANELRGALTREAGRRIRADLEAGRVTFPRPEIPFSRSELSYGFTVRAPHGEGMSEAFSAEAMRRLMDAAGPLR